MWFTLALFVRARSVALPAIDTAIIDQTAAQAPFNLMKLLEAVYSFKYSFILFTLCLNVGGGYFAKMSATATGFVHYRYMLIAIACYATGFFSYIVALKFIPLFVAQSLLISQYVAMVLLSSIVFHESMTPYQVGGMALILIGLALLVGK